MLTVSTEERITVEEALNHRQIIISFDHSDLQRAIVTYCIYLDDLLFVIGGFNYDDLQFVIICSGHNHLSFWLFV